MKYLAICVLLLPLVWSAAVPQPRGLVPDMSVAEDGLEESLVPDMSVASDGIDASSKRLVPPFRFMSGPSADIDQVPDISVAADAEDNEPAKVVAADLDLVPDMSVAADAHDQVIDNLDLVPDMSVASDAL